MQNIPRADPESETKSEVKKLFQSRFGKDGQVLEGDYSQLEVVGKAVLSDDRNLKRDLIKGIDFHCKRVSVWKKVTYEEALEWCKNEDHPKYPIWKVYRTQAKIFSFQMAYGAGAKKIAEYLGLPIEEVEALFETEKKLYPRVFDFDDEVIEAVHQSARGTGRYERTQDHKAFEVLKGEWYAPTGTRYIFSSYEAQEFMRKRGVLTTFMPTEIKNYPTQGESGFFVQGAIGQLARRFLETDNYGGKAFLTNTVHDSVWVDAHNDVVLEVARDMKRLMERVPEWADENFGWEIDVPFPVDIEAGDNLYDKHKLKGI